MMALAQSHLNHAYWLIQSILAADVLIIYMSAVCHANLLCCLLLLWLPSCTHTACGG